MRPQVFGFPSSPDIPIPERNLGLYDQRFAFDWIQQNIEAFGGDSGKLTIWGQSAGALSVDQHLKAYATELPLPFRAAIMSSGQTSFGLLASPSPSDGKEWSALASAVGCANSTGGMDCMKKISPEDLVEAMSKHSISCGPELDHVTVWGSPAELWNSGQVTRVPILTGTVAEEGRSLVNDEVDLASWLEANLPDGLIKEEDREVIVSVYRSTGLTADFDIASAITTDFLWLCVRFLVSRMIRYKTDTTIASVYSIIHGSLPQDSIMALLLQHLHSQVLP